jgi:hypothetical protein
LQLTTARWLGAFLPDPTDVPGTVLGYVARQLDVADPSCVGRYLERRPTRFDHGWLRERDVLLPGVTTLARLVARARADGDERLWEALAAAPTVEQARLLEGLLEVCEARFSDLERWRKGPADPTGESLRLSLRRVAEIHELGIDASRVRALVPARRLVELARYGMAAKAPRLRRHPRARRVATLLATVVHLQAASIDDCLELFDLLMVTELLGKAERETDRQRARDHPRLARASAQLAAAVGKLLDAASSAQPVDLGEVWDQIEEVVPREQLRAAVNTVQELVPFDDEDDEGKSVLTQFHRLLVRREIYAPGSSRWREPRAQLLDGEAWANAKGPVLTALSLPENPDQLLEQHARTLDNAYREVSARLGPDAKVTVDEEGKLHVSALKAIPDPASLVQVRGLLEGMVPRVSVPEVILEVMSWHPEFVQAFTSVSGGRTRLADLEVTVAACLSAHAMNIGFDPIVKRGVAALERGRVSHVDQNYMSSETYKAANPFLVDGQAGIPLARAWGGGMVAGIDGMRFIVPVPSIYARPNLKYFGNKRGVTWLNVISDQAMGLAAKVVSGAPKDSLHMLDVIFGQDHGQRTDVLVADSTRPASSPTSTRARSPAPSKRSGATLRRQRGTATAPQSLPGSPGATRSSAGPCRRCLPTASAEPSAPTTPTTCRSERSTANSPAVTFRYARRRCGGCCMRPPPAPRRSSRSTSSSSTSPTAERPSAPKAARPNGCTGAPAPLTCSHACSGCPTEPGAPADRCSSPTANQPPPDSHRPATSGRTPADPGSDTTAPASSCTATQAGGYTSSDTPPPPTSARRRSRYS